MLYFMKESQIFTIYMTGSRVIKYYFNMKVNNYLLLQQIGSGKFSTVFKAADYKDRTKIYAIKSLRQIPQNQEQQIRKQIDLLKQIQKKHVKNVVNYITDFKEKGKWYIVLQYCGKGDLQNYLIKQKRLPQIFCKSVAYSTIQALSQLHQKGIAHRDLKLSNILINDDYDFKIADFGLANIQQNGVLQSYCGTPYAMAPQVLKKQSYDTKCDIWSLGIMIYRLIFGVLPFDGRKFSGDLNGLIATILHKQPDYNSVRVSEQCISFIKLCLKKNPKDRPTMRQLSTHPWLSSGVSSLIRKDILKKSFQEKEVKDQIINIIKQVMNQTMHDHINKLIKLSKLNNIEINKFMKTLDNYYKDNNKIKLQVLFMIAKILKQVKNTTVTIHIQKMKLKPEDDTQLRKFIIKMSKIDIFKAQQKSIQTLIQQFISKLPQQNLTQHNFQREIISFAIDQAQSCMSLGEQSPDKVALLQYLSKLPIYIMGDSSLYIKCAFNQVNGEYQNLFNQILEEISESQAVQFMNLVDIDHCDEKMYVVENQFYKQRRNGPEIELGEFISKVIDFNVTNNNRE